ncbi:MAG: NAD(P)(+) transhydrogenase (Re/Si-specific) subunit beta [Saprospiraceae bacterium]|nr:NAD(P)(+) transhydrogenase (Re/Si-specific) subunit beta [Saprospiraceae bacterium]
MMEHLLEVIYLIAAVTFMLGLKMLSKPDTARKGNSIAAFGMILAIFATIFIYRDAHGMHLKNLWWIFIALIIGTVIGYLMAKRVQMTAMPQMVSFFNGMGGACAAIISIIEFGHLEYGMPEDFSSKITIILAGLVIGTVSFAGSMIAFGKLEGKINDYCMPGQQFFNVGLLLAIFAASILFGTEIIGGSAWFYSILGLSVLYGLLFVFPIGGADMPVVISLLNSFTGVAAACGGFLYDNYVMLIGGILVGSAGTILTVAMCTAMNRSLLNVLVGNFGGGSAAAGSGSTQGSTKEISLSDASVLMKYSKKVVIVPGYGLAVAQAQHICHELESILEEEGVDVKYAIHPVAGRMPGHMNVLLAESNVSYDQLIEMEEINPEFNSTDVVLVVGANDVVNPAAKTDPSSPIYGMPILEVEDAKNIIILKRSMKAGYAGIDNELFYRPKTYMLFGDAKDSLTKLVTQIKAS